MFKHLEDAQQWIESVHRFGDKYDLKRMEKATEMLGHPERSFKSIHIGGTNGKGSTLTYLKHIYLNAGYTVGTYTSPYILRFNERITLNNEEISDEDLLKYINRIYEFDKLYLSLYNDQISFFELVTLISFLYFQEKQPDIALIEVGLGGTLDATNVIIPEAAVITNIGFDHMHVLGNTLESIATNKLGIVKKGKPLFTNYSQPELESLFKETVKARNATMYHLNEEPLTNVVLGRPTTFHFMQREYTLTMAGAHQVENAALALFTAAKLHELNIFSVSTEALRTGIEEAFWPGRFEIFDNVIIDGAHNYEGLQRCFETVKSYFPNHRIKALFTVMKDKDYQAMLSVIEDYADQVYFTEIPYPRCEKAEVISEISNHPHKMIVKNFHEAYNLALPKDKREVLIVTGSLYFISEIRKKLIAKRD